MRRSILCFLTVLVAGPAVAQRSSPDPVRFVRWMAEDVTSLGRSTVSLRSLYVVAGMSGTLLLLSGQDDDLTRATVDFAAGIGPTPRRILNEVGNANVVRPMAVLFFLGTLITSNERLQDAAFTSVEAIIFANLLTNALKLVVGRARPDQEEGATSFKPFSGSRSFPSGHATTVFAFATPWLMYYKNVSTITLFLLGLGTAFVRMADNRHWFTDVLTGSAIGFGTGYFLSRRHQGRGSRIDIVPLVSAGEVGFTARVRL